jgi:putative permease
VPIIYDQIKVFFNHIPEYKEHSELLINKILVKIGLVDNQFAKTTKESLTQIIHNFISVINSMTHELWGYTLATINFISIFTIVPFILYYFLQDWNSITKTFYQLIPQSKRGLVNQIIFEIDDLFAKYLKGQMNLCFIMSVYYILGMHYIKLDLAILLGLISGFLVIIPMIGFSVSFLISLINCYLLFDYGYELFFIIGLFVVGHIVEASYLTPKIIGDNIGLHPAWIIFSLLVSGSIFGIVGIIFAVPIAGVIKILLRHLIKWYKKTDFFLKE